MGFDFKNKVAIVTGAASGIGLAYVRELLLNGCLGVSVLDVNKGLGQKTLEELKCEFGSARVLFLHVNVTSKSELESAFEVTVATFKHLDIVINNAAINDEENFEQTINVNLTAVIRGTKLALNHLPKYRSGDEGIIVNTSSISALIYYEDTLTYTTSKVGVTILGKMLGSNYEKTKVRILTICPGATYTAMFKQALQANQVDVEKLKTSINLDDVQSPEAVGKALISVINEGKSGSIWVVDRKPAYEIDVTRFL